MGTPKLNHWLIAMKRELQPAEDPVPRGYKSCVEIAEESGFSEPHICKLLRRGVAIGKVEFLRLRRLDSNGRLRRLGYYKPKA